LCDAQSSSGNQNLEAQIRHTTKTTRILSHLLHQLSPIINISPFFSHHHFQNKAAAV